LLVGERRSDSDPWSDAYPPEHQDQSDEFNRISNEDRLHLDPGISPLEAAPELDAGWKVTFTNREAPVTFTEPSGGVTTTTSGNASGQV
jgi:hypothetical protein